MEEPIGHFFQGVTKKEFLEEVISRGMLGYPVSTAREILEDPQLKARGFWQTVDHPELGTSLLYPGAFAKFSSAECPLRRRAPLIGEHNEEVYVKELGLKSAEIDKLKESGIL